MRGTGSRGHALGRALGRPRGSVRRGAGLIALGAWVAAAPALAAAPLSIRAVLDKSVIEVGEHAQVTVIVEARGVTLPDFAFPRVPGLHVVRVGDSQSFAWTQGKLARASSTIFLVSASAPGRYVIPAIRIASGRERAQSLPLHLDVDDAAGVRHPLLMGRPRAAPPAGGTDEESDSRVWGDASLPEVFAKLEVDRSRAYWNQQITARFICYTRVRLDQEPAWDIAEAPGFWREALGGPRRSRVRLGDQDYVAFEQDVAYFPTRSGRLVLGPGRVEVRLLRRVEARDPWSVLGLPETRVETVVLRTEAAPVQVLPLPAGAPPGFKGGVGRLSMDVKLDRVVARAGEPVTVITVLRGQGNLNAAGNPEVRSVTPVRSFEAGGGVTRRNDGLRVVGERRHETAFVPESAGRFLVAPIRFTWFDPEEARYRTQVSDTIRIAVLAAGAEGDSGRTWLASPPALRRKGSGPAGSLDPAPPAGAAALALGSAIAFAGVLLVTRAERRAALDPRRRRRAALERIARELHAVRAERALHPSAAARAELLVREALAARYGADLEGRPREEALRVAREHGAGEAVVAKARALLETLERSAYAPAGELRAGGSDPLAAAEAFLADLRMEAG